MIGEPGQGFRRALVGMVLLDHPVALGSRSENRMQGEAGAVTAKLREGDGGAKLNGFEVVAATVMVADPLWLHDLIEGDAVVIVATVGPVHHEAPDAAHAHVEGAGGGGETSRSPSLRQVLGIGPDLKHERAGRIELTPSDDRTGVLIEVDAIRRGHRLVPSVLDVLAAKAGRSRRRVGLWRLALQCLEVLVEAIEALLPQPAVIGEPSVNALQRPRGQATGTPLRLASA